jgi:hypothetical protein
MIAPAEVPAAAPAEGGFLDGSGTDARFNHPGALALAPDGTLYIADTGNAALRTIAPDATATVGTIPLHAGDTGGGGNTGGSDTGGRKSGGRRRWRRRAKPLAPRRPPRPARAAPPAPRPLPTRTMNTTTPTNIRRLAIFIFAMAATTLAPMLRAADAQPAAPEYKKGLWLNIWTHKNKPLDGDFPNWGEAGSIALAAQPFSPGAVKDDPDYKNYHSQPFFFGLEGYLKITKSGAHTLAVDVENTGQTYAFVGKYSIYVEGNCLARSESKALTGNDHTLSVSADATLEPGMYRVRIPFDMLYDKYKTYQGDALRNNYSNIKITFRLKEPGARRARVLTEEDLYHKE